MTTRMEKYHGDVTEKTGKLSAEDMQMLKDLYDRQERLEEQVAQLPRKKPRSINRFLTWGIVIESILLVIILWIAFSK